ncbi:MAG: elongation factor P maturation arginine rhamnosyltransferase EarP, partial [Fibrobacter sp.]|nr:elongation factor P maturation arginine rhamnosyltransferase EarP [Fibrobacter sp.]
MQFKNIDIFCQVIDNFGDAGVVYRFAKEFKIKHNYCRVRVFIDNLDVLQSIDRSISTECFSQKIEDITWIDSTQLTVDLVRQLGTAEIIIEAFACQIPECYLESALFNNSLIINLEYLSAEGWVEGYHLKESLLSRGNSRKFFFMPGFSTGTGGLIFNSWFKNNKEVLKAQKLEILRSHIQKNSICVEFDKSSLVGSVFTYQRGFDAFLRDLESLDKKIIL